MARNGQNTSSAVMAQRAEPNDSLDFFPTPPWATRALCEWLKESRLEITLNSRGAFDPACGQGHMARPLAEYFQIVHASDVHDYGFGAVRDFLFPGDHPEADWIITNPPFRLGMEFALTALDRSRYGVALLVRTAFLEGGARFAQLFAKHRPYAVLQFCERVPMVKGRYDPKASTATSYCWIVWTKNKRDAQTIFDWIPPCRAKLERRGDW